MISKRVRVLLTESGSCEASQALRELYPESAGGVDLTIVSAIGTLLPTLRVVDPEVLLLDLAMLQPDFREMVRHIHRAAPDVPLIVLADPSNKEQAAACLQEGAMGYLQKGFTDRQTLGRMMRNVLEQNTLKGLADLLRDPLTGLYIREGFLTLGLRSVEAARQNGGTLVLLCALCENLEAVREAFGPRTAGHLLCKTARIISRCFRRTDLVARIGEAQFAALAVDAAEPSATVLRQRVEKHIAMQTQEGDEWGPLEIRISAGHWSPSDIRTFPEFLDAVETGLRFSSRARPAEPTILREANHH